LKGRTKGKSGIDDDIKGNKEYLEQIWEGLILWTGGPCPESEKEGSAW
jgi:hypothetical protein